MFWFKKTSAHECLNDYIACANKDGSNVSKELFNYFLNLNQFSTPCQINLVNPIELMRIQWIAPNLHKLKRVYLEIDFQQMFGNYWTIFLIPISSINNWARTFSLFDWDRTENYQFIIWRRKWWWRYTLKWHTEQIIKRCVVNIKSLECECILRKASLLKSFKLSINFFIFLLYTFLSIQFYRIWNATLHQQQKIEIETIKNQIKLLSTISFDSITKILN